MNLFRLIRNKIKYPAEHSLADPITELYDCITTEGGMAEFSTDKLTEEYTLRIPECTDRRLRGLSKLQRKALNEQTLIVMAKFPHDAAFDPNRYLIDDYESRGAIAR